MGRLKGKVAIVTGAGSGIGRASAKLFAAEGAAVVVADIDTKGGRRTAAEIERAGGTAVFHRHDVAKEADWRALMGDVRRRFRALHVLFNNAGIQFCKTVEDTSLADWRRVMTVNAEGTFLGTKYAIAAMKRSKAPCSIVNMSSTYGLVGDDLNAAYCASKAAVTNFSKAAALHCGRKGYPIRVNTVHPGAILTPLTRREMRDIAHRRGLKGPRAARKEWEAVHPIGRIGEPIEIAYGALYLASDESLFVTGAELVIDGGFMAQ